MLSKVGLRLGVVPFETNIHQTTVYPYICGLSRTTSGLVPMISSNRRPQASNASRFSLS